MGAAAPVMMGAQLAGGALSAYSQEQAGAAASRYYGFMAQTSRTNAGLAKAAADSRISEIGQESLQQSARVGESVRATIGAQRAAAASGGAGGSSKTTEQLASDTMNKGNIDEMSIRYNAGIKSKAARVGASFQALADETQAQGYDMAGKNAVTASRLGAASSLLGSSGTVASEWYKYKSPNGGMSPYAFSGIS